MKNEPVKLITITPRRDADGFEADSDRKETEVMAEIRSVKYTEYYQAVHAGVEVQAVAGINRADYAEAVVEAEGKKIQPELVVFDGTEYRIIRRYEKKRKLELTLQEVE